MGRVAVETPSRPEGRTEVGGADKAERRDRTARLRPRLYLVPVSGLPRASSAVERALRTVFRAFARAMWASRKQSTDK